MQPCSWECCTCRKERHKRPERILNEIIKNDADNVMALYYLGTISLERKDFEKAEELFKRVTNLRPTFDAAYLSLGLTSEIRNDTSCPRILQ